MIIPKKEQIVNFVQIYSKEDNKPLIKCYSKEDPTQRMYFRGEKERAVGYGDLSITADNIIHLYPGKEGKINLEHLNKYKESRKKNLLKIIVH